MRDHETVPLLVLFAVVVFDTLLTIYMGEEASPLYLLLMNFAPLYLLMIGKLIFTLVCILVIINLSYSLPRSKVLALNSWALGIYVWLYSVAWHIQIGMEVKWILSTNGSSW